MLVSSVRWESTSENKIIQVVVEKLLNKKLKLLGKKPGGYNEGIKEHLREK